MRSYNSAVISENFARNQTSSMATNQPANPVIDINHPYYLSSADHPGLAVVKKVLKNHNY